MKIAFFIILAISIIVTLLIIVLSFKNKKKYSVSKVILKGGLALINHLLSVVLLIFAIKLKMIFWPIIILIYIWVCILILNVANIYEDNTSKKEKKDNYDDEYYQYEDFF